MNAAVLLMIGAAPFAPHAAPPPPPPPPIVVPARPVPAPAPVVAPAPASAQPAPTAPAGTVVLQVQSCVVSWADKIDPTKTDLMGGPCPSVQAFAAANGLGPVTQVTNSVTTDAGTLAGS